MKLKFNICWFLIFFLLQGAVSQELGIFKSLKLTAGQENEIRNLIIEYSSKREQFQIQIHIKQLELRQHLLDDNAGLEQIKKTLKEIGAIELEIRLLRFLFDKDIIDILTPEQKKRYKYIQIKQAEKDAFKNQKQKGEENGFDQKPFFPPPKH